MIATQFVKLNVNSRTENLRVHKYNIFSKYINEGDSKMKSSVNVSTPTKIA